MRWWLVYLSTYLPFIFQGAFTYYYLLFKSQLFKFMVWGSVPIRREEIINLIYFKQKADCIEVTIFITMLIK